MRGPESADAIIEVVAGLFTNKHNLDDRFLSSWKLFRQQFGVEPRWKPGLPYAQGLAIRIPSRCEMLMHEQSRTQIFPSEELFRALVQNSSDMISLLDADGMVVYHSPPIERLLGYRPQDRISNNVFSDPIVHPADRAALREFFDKVRSAPGTLVTGQFRLCHADGSWKDVEAVGQNFLHDPAVAGIVANYRDITERKRSEEELHRTTQLLQAVVDGTQDAVYVKDRDGKHLIFNTAASRMVGKPAAEVLGRDDTAIWGADDVRLVVAHDRRVMETGVADTEEKELSAGGVTHTYLASKAPYRDGHGNIIGIIGICHDITDRKHSEEAVRQANERLELAMRGSNLSIWECDMPDGRIENSRMTLINMWELLGYDAATSPDDFPSAFAILFHPDDQQRVGKELGALFSGNGKEYESEYRVRRKDGSTRWHLARGTVLRDPEGKPIRFIGTSADITDRKRAEEALRQEKARVYLAVRGSNIAIWECNMPDGRIEDSHVTYTNVWESMGYDAETAPTDFPSRFAILFHPIDQERVMREIQELFDSGRQDYESEFRVRWKDGSTHWHLSRGTLLRDPDGKPVRFIGTSADITALKQAEEALRERERQLDSLMGHLPGLAYRALADDHWTALFVSKGIEELTGYPADEFTSRRLYYADIMLPEDRPTTREAVFGALRERRMYEVEHRIRHKDGSIRWIWARGHGVFAPNGSLRFIEGLNLDITRQKQAEERLRESEQRWRSLTETLPQLVWSATPDGECDYLSAQWTEHTGVSEAELLGWQWLEMLHPDDRQPTRRFWLESVAGHHSYDIEYRVRHKGGEYRWFKTRGVPIRDTGGNIVKWFGTCTDITELRDSEERFRGTFENAAVGIAHVHPTGQLLRVNETCCAILGYSREELLGKSFLDFTHADDLAATNERFAGMLRGELPGYATEKRYLRKDGSPIWAHVAVSLQRDAAGKPAYAIGVIQDISERKRLDAELRQAKDVAEAANRAKDEFLANVSHEIRTPMNAILGMAELTLDTPLTDEQRNNLDIVLTSAEGLLSLINDLLDFSKIEAGRIELEDADFSLRTLLNQTLRALALRAHKKGLELACQVEADVPDGLVGDGNRIRQVLLNLIGNAIKFTESGEVIVRVRLGQTGEQAVIEFEIADTGIGIPPEKQETIFLAFEQADSSTTRRYGGTGLGLTISARLVEMMGGKITVQSEVGHGSTFRFIARFGRSSSLAAAPAQPSVVDLHGLRVLIVDDNATNRTILQNWAVGWGMIPTETADGPAAMSALWRGVASKQPFALVLLDVRMPGTDGLELAKGISQTPELSACRIILLTSDDRPGDAKRYRALRITAVLTKPVQQEELLDNIYRVLSHGAVATDIAESVRTTASDTVHEPAPAAEERTSRPLNVLVAEDNKFNQQVIQRMLERRGHTVRVVPNGSETLAALEQSAFDLLLLDVNMPEMDGFQGIRTIREQEKTSGNHLRVIALTALSGKRDRERCIEAGMDDFLAKPVRAAEVYAALDRVLAVHPIAQPDAPAGNSALFDPAIILSGCADDAALLADMIQLFEEEAPQLLARVEAAVRFSDAEQLRIAAHSMRGLISSFSNRGANVAQVLEQLGIERRAGESAGQYEVLNQAVQELRTILPTLTIEKLRAQS